MSARERLTRCDRCGRDVVGFIQSMFNADIICFACKDDEREAPHYAEAARLEAEACQAGDLNFPGLGLAADDRAFLESRRLRRAAR